MTLYGRRRIRLFYQFLFYFDYVKAPAIILLPVWIAHEFLHQQLDVQGRVAYMAHASGFVTGALLIAWYRWRHQVSLVEATNQSDRGVGIPPAEGRLGQRQDRIRPLGQECRVHAAQALEQIQGLLGPSQA